ncbi:MAG: recombinase family protein [Sarcina sp.]
MLYGYARVSTKSQEDNTSLENQIKWLEENGCLEIYKEVHSGATMERPKFVELEKKLKKGDTLIVTKLDRFTRSTVKGIEKIKELADNGIKVNILNMGIVDLSNAMGKMMFTVLCAFAEYEKDCIVERMAEGRSVAKQKEDYREGRPKKYTPKQMENAMGMLTINGGDKSYSEVEEITNISKSTLIREQRKRNKEKLLNK